MNPNATITDEQFEAYLAQIRALVEGPFEELQKEVEVTNAFPDEFYELACENDLYRFYLPACYGGWNLSELEIPGFFFIRQIAGLTANLLHRLQNTLI